RKQGRTGVHTGHPRCLRHPPHTGARWLQPAVHSIDRTRQPTPALRRTDVPGVLVERPPRCGRRGPPSIPAATAVMTEAATTLTPPRPGRDRAARERLWTEAERLTTVTVPVRI